MSFSSAVPPFASSPFPLVLVDKLTKDKRRLSQLQFTTVKLGDALNLAGVEVSRSSGDFALASLVKEVDKSEVNEKAVEAWMLKASGARSFSSSSSATLAEPLPFRFVGGHRPSFHPRVLRFHRPHHLPHQHLSLARSRR